MVGKSLRYFKKLAKKVKVTGCTDSKSPKYEFLQKGENSGHGSDRKGGTFAVYVGEHRERFEVPTKYLGHPLLKILLEKAQEEFGFENQGALVVPCSITTFQEAMLAVQSCNGGFDFGELMACRQ